MGELPAEVAQVANQTDFWGAARYDDGAGGGWTAARGPASLRFDVPNRVDTPFALASGTKGFVALAVLSLVADGTLTLDTTARSLLGDDLPGIDDAVTVQHLLAHRSGIGDYYAESDDEDVPDPELTIPGHRLDSTEAYLQVLDGYPSVSAPGERFTYNNGGYVVLALLAERASGVALGPLLQQRVVGPAGLTATVLARVDAPPAGAAEGYLDVDGQWCSHVPHLPVLGGGDGGLYSTVADVSRFWPALTAGRIVPPALVEAALQRHSVDPDGGYGYGLGFWLHPTRPLALLEGADPGISFRSVHDRESGATLTVVANTTDGAWPVIRAAATLHGLR